LNFQSQNSSFKSQPCDLCGSTESDSILVTPRLDGPLVRCRQCQLFYVRLPQKREPDPGPDRHGSIHVAAEMVRLSERARELALVEPKVEENEKPWRELMATERLNDLKRFVTKGRLLEIGCSTGEMLAAAGSSFTVAGVEADEKNSLIARSRGLDCFSGTLSDARFPDCHFDVVALYHVIEHFHSPRAELSEIHRVLKPGGLLVVETPNIATIWFHLLGARWRQFIPDHIFFFTPQTMTQLCEDNGFEIRELRNVGKIMSLRLFVSRLGRYHRPTARFLTTLSARFDLNDRTLRLNLGDVMRVYAKKRMKDEG
jgi:SAM-dependent methyltransferase